MKFQTNGVIIDGIVYIAKTASEPKQRCTQCELECCDGESMGDTICANILASNEFFIKSKELSEKLTEHDRNKS